VKFMVRSINNNRYSSVLVLLGKNVIPSNRVSPSNQFGNFIFDLKDDVRYVI
jgi:hypothetical protein